MLNTKQQSSPDPRPKSDQGEEVPALQHTKIQGQGESFFRGTRTGELTCPPVQIPEQPKTPLQQGQITHEAEREKAVVGPNKGERALNQEVRHGGRIRNFVDNWGKLTSDQSSINYIKGVTLKFEDLPQQTFIPRPYKFDLEEKFLITQEVHSFLDREIFEEALPCQGQFISNTRGETPPRTEIYV